MEILLQKLKEASDKELVCNKASPLPQAHRGGLSFFRSLFETLYSHLEVYMDVTEDHRLIT